MRGGLGASIGACLFGSLLIVPDAGAADEDIFFSELPVVASVSRLPQRLADAPTAVTVIDREIIKASGARDLNDIFRLVPGFLTYPNNTDSARVTYHGITDEEYSPRVQVLIDGRSQYSALFRNGVNWATLPVAIEDIERIEVVRGSNSASYGSNAFLGVINIITVDPLLAHGFSASTNYGNQGIRDYRLRHGGKLGEAGNFRVTYQQADDNGLTDQFDWKDSLSSRLFDLRADFSLNDRDSLQLGAGRVEAVMLRGRLAKRGNVLTGGDSPGWPIHDYSQSNSYFQLQWQRSLSSDSDVQFRYSYVEDKADERYVANEGGYLYHLNDAGGRGVRHEMELQHNFRPFDKTRLVWGGGWRSDSLESAALFAGKSLVQREVGRVFGNFELKPVDWFTGNFGLSAEHDSLAGTHTSPRISGSYHLTPENTLRLGYSRAYRTGSIVDYRANQVQSPFAKANGRPFGAGEQARATSYPLIGDPGMPAERMDSWELGYLGDWKDWRMSLDVRIFQEKIPNRLLQVFNDPDYTAPVQKIRIEGIEYQWKWQPFSATRIMLGQSFVHIASEFLASALKGPLLDTGSQNLANLDLLAEKSAPTHTTSLLLMQKLPLGFEFSTAGYWLGDMKWTRNSQVGSYHRIDARLGYPFKLGATSGEVAYTAQSINGEHGEFKASGQPADRVVEQRHWLTLRIDL